MSQKASHALEHQLDRLIAKMASYTPEFLQAVSGKKYRNPDTGNEVLFVSLPHAEQAKIYEQWGEAQERDETGKRRRHSLSHDPVGPKRVHDLSKAKAKHAIVGDDTFDPGSFVRDPIAGKFYEVGRTTSDKVFGREVDEHGRPISRGETVFREIDDIQKIEAQALTPSTKKATSRGKKSV